MSRGMLEMLRAHRRAANVAGALASFAMIGYALYTQRFDALEPCPLCIFQRIAIFALGVGFLVAAALPSRRWAGRLGAVVVALPALAAVGVAARHMYIQSLPPGQVPACGATLDYMWEVFPVMDVLRKVLTGSGECAAVDWTFLGLTMPGWVLVCALVLGAWGMFANWPRRG
ncbi:MAG: disulfide bond formation protein B [Steroidobacteraceae bacterium]